MRISDWSSDVCSSDLFHHEKEDWQTVGPQTYEGPGWLPIYTLERMLGRDIESGGADTIGGLVMPTLDRVPQTGAMVELDRLRILVLEVAGLPIAHLRVLAQQHAHRTEGGGGPLVAGRHSSAGLTVPGP